MEIANDPVFRNIWQRFAEICENASPYMGQGPQKARSLLERAGLVKPPYERLLRQAQALLGAREADAEFAAIERLSAASKRLRDEAAELKRKRIMAPESSRNPFTSTREALDKKIMANEAGIAANEVEIERLKSKIAGIMARKDIPLCEEEIGYLIISAEGDDILGLISIAHNMKKIQGAIEAELRRDPGNAQLARLYAGMYLLALEAYAASHDQALENIGSYRARLKTIWREAKSNNAEAQKLKRSVKGQDLSHIEANIKLCGKTIEAARLYDELMLRRSKNLAAARRSLNPRIKVARNTYKTLANGSTLIEAIDSANIEYSNLMNFEMPELKNIFEKEMLATFTSIAGKIRMEMT